MAAACNDLLHAFLDVLTLENFVETLPELFEHAPVPVCLYLSIGCDASTKLT